MSLSAEFKEGLKLRLRSEAEAVKREKLERLDREYSKLLSDLRSRYERAVEKFVSNVK